MKSSSTQHGFTLLELLLAITIFSALSIACWGMLSGVLRTHEQTGHTDLKIRQASQIMRLLVDDISGFVPRQSRATNAVLIIENNSFMFTSRRTPSDSGHCCAPDIQRIRWFLKDETLYRAVGEYPDNPREQQKSELLRGVHAMRIRYYMEGWHPFAGKEVLRFGNESALPRGIEIAFTLTDGSHLIRQFLLSSRWPTAEKTPLLSGKKP